MKPLMPATAKSAIAVEGERLQLGPDIVSRLMLAIDEAVLQLDEFRSSGEPEFICEAARRDQVEAAWGG